MMNLLIGFLQLETLYVYALLGESLVPPTLEDRPLVQQKLN